MEVVLYCAFIVTELTLLGAKLISAVMETVIILQVFCALSLTICCLALLGARMIVGAFVEYFLFVLFNFEPMLILLATSALAALD